MLKEINRVINRIIIDDLKSDVIEECVRIGESKFEILEGVLQEEISKIPLFRRLVRKIILSGQNWKKEGIVKFDEL